MIHKKIFQTLTLKQLRNFVGNNYTVRKFADTHDLVYFGALTQDDESRLVKGITISNSHHDSHYCVGTVMGRDVIYLQRTDALLGSHTPRREHYTWNILELDLRETLELPHIYIEGKYRHNTAFYETLSMKHREFSPLPDHFLHGYDPLFAERFVVRMSAASSLEFASLLSPERAAVMAHHFHHFDFEWRNDTLYVYYLSRQPSFDKLNLMMRAGVWLAAELEAATNIPTPSE